ncbi:MAG: F0F1 ATP synthase subunit B [Flavobacteriales bacterium]|nr:F0F1 ATP synthase subunit B [Flavobacteriales bacterium]MBK7085611.1 F0F1 ATP synthase subunit B [Flavobacteriales bacterium]MBK7751254.1 F0F1 ATP synthase subunit B [Flavobacteriales bacterium]MBK9073603.1 F0F1 ATP synthase subunit B [Flavobacteriales bacterium]MBK9539287.1 F0F1 ATP synthase subunit B [Flavobacteriales bacterium]
MELVTPPIGLLFWMCLSFGIVVWLLAKYAWKPILSSVSQRERSIEDALNEAKKMREDMARMSAGNEELMRHAREEREVMLKEARDIRDQEIAGAKTKAKAEAEALLGRAREDIRNEKNAAITEMKNQVAELSVTVAEIILREKLGSEAAQHALVDKVMKDADLRKS